MENYEIKTVPFMGDELMAVRDDGGKIWVGVHWMCDGIGLTEGQRKRQITNIQSDRVLSKGGSNLVLPTNSGNQSVFCLDLEFVPLWLAKINITPTMQSESPEVADKLEQYQLKVKDVLAAAFIPQSLKPTMTLTELVAAQAQIMVDFEKRMDAQGEKLDAIADQTADLAARTAALSTRVDGVVKAFSRPTEGNWKVDTDMAIKELSLSIAFRGRLYAELEARSGCNLNNRVSRARNRLRKNGATYAQAMTFGKLDCIAADKRLQEIFNSIIREHQTVAVEENFEKCLTNC